jgi:hypothetical protein
MEVDDTDVYAPPTAEQVIRRRNAEIATQETLYKQRRILQENAVKATTQHLVASSLATLKKEAATAILRLRAKNWPGGRLEEVVVSYTPIYSRLMRKRVTGHFDTKVECAVWSIVISDNYEVVLLGSDGVLYFRSEVIIDGRRYRMDYHPIDMPNNKFFKLTDTEIKTRTAKTVQSLRQLGRD